MINQTVKFHQKLVFNKTAQFNYLSTVNYDSTGASLFIIGVIVWYSLGIICMLAIEIQGPNETMEVHTRRRAKLLIRNLREQTHTKEILEELVDKEKRNKLWNIYLDRKHSNTKRNYKLIEDEIVRIKNIEKQLAIINQNHKHMNEYFLLLEENNCTLFDSQSINDSNLSLIESRARVRRRSSFDQQIIERWKYLVTQCKTHEQLPWTVQKLMIRRHFRQNYKKNYCRN